LNSDIAPIQQFKMGAALPVTTLLTMVCRSGMNRMLAPTAERACSQSVSRQSHAVWKAKASKFMAAKVLA
jgi:hypothetical protein